MKKSARKKNDVWLNDPSYPYMREEVRKFYPGWVDRMNDKLLLKTYLRLKTSGKVK